MAKLTMFFGTVGSDATVNPVFGAISQSLNWQDTYNQSGSPQRDTLIIYDLPGANVYSIVATKLDLDSVTCGVVAQQFYHQPQFLPL